MKRFSTSLRRYQRQVRSYLPCSGKQKRRILAGIHERVNAFVAEHSDCTFAEVEAHFGSPQDIAVSCLENMNLKELLQTIRLRRRIVTILVSAVLIAISLWAGCITAAYHEHVVDTNGYYTVEIE